MPKRSILLTIDDEEWNLFKSKVSLSGSSMARVFKDFIRKYTARKPAESVVVKDTVPEGKSHEEKDETPVRKNRFCGAKPLEKEKHATIDLTLLHYARAFSISVEDKREENLLDEVLDAIENDYKKHEKLGEKAFGEYLDREQPTLEWFNDVGGKEC